MTEFKRIQQATYFRVSGKTRAFAESFKTEPALTWSSIDE